MKFLSKMQLLSQKKQKLLSSTDCIVLYGNRIAASGESRNFFVDFLAVSLWIEMEMCTCEKGTEFFHGLSKRRIKSNAATAKGI